MRTKPLPQQGDIMLKKTLIALGVAAVLGVISKLIVSRVRAEA